MTPFPLRTLFVAIAVALSTLAQAEEAQDALDPQAATTDDATTAEGETRKLDQIVVTGSHIKRIEVEGPLPISTIKRSELMARGEPELGAALRDLPYNSFGSIGDIPNSGIPNVSLPSLRGLGSKYTLSLLDGHRLPGFAGLDGGAASSVTGIPLAAIDRIEVLRDGASAVYGSDAIGGVINLLTRREDTEPQLELSLEHPQQSGGESRRASLVYGRSHARGHWLLAAELQDREPLYGADRDYLIEVAPLSRLGNPGTYRRIDPDTEDYVGPSVADPRCPTATDTDPVFPSSTLNFNGTRCLYRFRDISAERGGYEGRSLFATARYDLSDTLTGFARVLAIDADNLTQLAPTPLQSLIIQADNPNNPTRGELGPDLGYPLEFDYRLTPLGPRINEAEEQNLHALLGIDGLLDWADGGSWSLSLTHNRLDYDIVGVAGGALRSAFQDALDSGRFNPFTAEPGNPVGLEGVAYQSSQTNEWRGTTLELAASVDGDFFGGLSASYAVGLEADHTGYLIDADSLLNAGEVLGFFGPIPDEAASRNHGSVYAEMLLPLGERLELNFAARYDRYQDAGGALVPKLALAFRPTEHWLLRAALGKGFQAPDLVSAYGPGFSYDDAQVDEIDCAAHPEDPNACERRPVTVRVVPNPDLGPERARQGSIGVVWQPLDGLELALDYYRTRVSDQIGNLPPGLALELELACLQAGQVCDPIQAGQVIRDVRGNIDTIILPYINIAGTETGGLDFELGARRTTRFGEFSLDLRASKVKEFEFVISPTLPPRDALGSYFAPPWRAMARLGWELGNHGLSVGVEHTDARGDCFPATLPSGVINPACEDVIPSHTEVDAQWRWKTPWDGEIALGGRNLGNRPPPHDAFGGYQYGLYDPNGRVWYLRYRHQF